MALLSMLVVRSPYKANRMNTWLKQHVLKARHWFAVLALLVAFAPAVAHASVYGSGAYNTDVYNGSDPSGGGSSGGGSSGSSGSSGSGAVTQTDTSSASSTDESTVVETPSGLEVAINLADGQVIPSTGYYITITPLNGEGKSFDKAEIYLDGELIYTGSPDATGTLKWFWDTAKYPASKVKIVVYGPGAGVTTKEFSVTIGTAAQDTNNQSATGAESVPDTSSGFPTWLWWFFGLLILLVVLLIWWLIARRRRQNDQQLPPPPTYTPMQ